jgi:hypothetical protein
VAKQKSKAPADQLDLLPPEILSNDLIRTAFSHTRQISGLFANSHEAGARLERLEQWARRASMEIRFLKRLVKQGKPIGEPDELDFEG